MIRVAVGLINKYGDTGVMTKRVLDPYDPVTGSQGTTDTDYTIRMYLGRFTSSDISAGLYGVNDYYVLVWMDQTLDKSWRCNGDEIRLVSTVKTQDTNVLYKLVVRGQNV